MEKEPKEDEADLQSPGVRQGFGPPPENANPALFSGFETAEGRWVTVRQAAEQLGYNRHSLQKLVKAGKLESVQVERLWFINLEGFSNYLAQRRPGGRPRRVADGPQNA